MALNPEFVTAYRKRGKREIYEVGIVTKDGRVRLDQSDLTGWTFWKTDWKDPANPWLGGTPLEQVTGLRPDYT